MRFSDEAWQQNAALREAIHSLPFNTELAAGTLSRERFRFYIAQDAIDLHTEAFPIFSDTDWMLQPMFVDTNPFLFRGSVCGAMVRLSSSPIINVASGGGETGFFVIKDAT